MRLVITFETFTFQGFKKSAILSSGTSKFSFGQGTFYSHLPDGQGPRRVVCHINKNKSKPQLAQGKQNWRATCPKDKIDFTFFLSPGTIPVVPM